MSANNLPNSDLNQGLSSVPPGTTFPTGTTPDTIKLLGVTNGVKASGTCTYEEDSKGVQHHPRGIQDSREPIPLVQGSREIQQQG